MKLLRFLLVAMLIAPALAQTQSTSSEYIRGTVFPATALLYYQDFEGNYSMLCTATAVDKNASSYTFVSASHCACDYNRVDKTTNPKVSKFFVSPEKGDKLMIPATIAGCGSRDKGDDFVLLNVQTDYQFPVVPLGKDPDYMEPVVNVASPLGLNKQIFFGTISSPKLDRPLDDEDGFNWTDAVGIELPIAGGSSGSSVVCMDQRAVCAFLVGRFTKLYGMSVAIPVSRLERFRSRPIQ